MVFSESAKYYDAIYAARGKDYEREAELLHRLIAARKASAGNALLDVGCGTGAHLMHLRGQYEVEGLDLDEGMLEIARMKLPGVPLHHGDMVDFSLAREFDVVVNLFSSIGYVRSAMKLDSATVNMARHACPGGLVMVEPWIYPEQFTAGRAHALFVDQPGLKIARMDVSKIENGLSVLDFHYLVAEEGGVRYFKERHEVALFTHDEYLSAFRLARLKVDYDPEGLDGRGLYIGSKAM
jgi:SAM-dependent methyltransferase